MRSNKFMKYFWRVQYFDGTIINQFTHGKEIQWSEIDESQIKKASWMKKMLFGSKTMASIELKQNEKILICRRTHVGIGIVSGKEKERKMEYLLGKNGEYILKL